MEPTGSDLVKSPAHYDMPIQPITFIRANRDHICFLAANVIKYISRHRKKNGKEDLLKARYYLDMMIEDYYPEPVEVKNQDDYRLQGSGTCYYHHESCAITEIGVCSCKPR